MDLNVLMDLEQAGWEALCDGTAASFYGQLMADDGLMVLANGQIMTRPEVVEALSASPPWASYSIDQPRIVAMGVDSAALIYIGTASRGPEEPLFVGAMSSVYVHDGTNWTLSLYQQTPLPSPAA